MRYEILDSVDGNIINTIEATEEFCQQNYSFYRLVVEDAPEKSVTWLISVGAFFDRFGDQKIPILSDTNVTTQALIKDAQVRKYIDLKRADLSPMLDFLLSRGFTFDKDLILNTPAGYAELS